MELEAAVRGRRSIRKFTDKEVPEVIVEEILDAARWSPSWGNTQPWEFYVLTGRPLAEFKEDNGRMLEEELPSSPDVPMPDTWPAALKARYGELGKGMLDMLGINRADKDARNQLYARMASLFGAPCMIVACIHEGIACRIRHARRGASRAVDLPARPWKGSRNLHHGGRGAVPRPVTEDRLYPR